MTKIKNPGESYYPGYLEAIDKRFVREVEIPPLPPIEMVLAGTHLRPQGQKIRIMRSWEKQEEKRVYRMEQLRRLHDAWQDQVELWDMDLIKVKDR